jgi:hypothetical protein
VAGGICTRVLQFICREELRSTLIYEYVVGMGNISDYQRAGISVPVGETRRPIVMHIIAIYDPHCESRGYVREYLPTAITLIDSGSSGGDNATSCLYVAGAASLR